MGLPSKAAWPARCSGLSSQVQLSGNSPADTGNSMQMSEPTAIRRDFFVLMLHGVPQRALAGNSESLSLQSHPYTNFHMIVEFLLCCLPTSKRFWNKAQGWPALWRCGPTLGKRPTKFFNLEEVVAPVGPTAWPQPLRGWRRGLCEPCRSVGWRAASHPTENRYKSWRKLVALLWLRLCRPKSWQLPSSWHFDTPANPRFRAIPQQV